MIISVLFVLKTVSVELRLLYYYVGLPDKFAVS